MYINGVLLECDFINSDISEFMEMVNNKGLIKVCFNSFIEMVDKEGIAKVLKGLGVYKTTGARMKTI